MSITPLRHVAALALRLDTRPTRFVLVGVTGVGVSTAVLWFSTQVVALPAPVGGVAASVTSTFTNFLLNDVFTWRQRRSSLRMRARRLVRYYSTTAAGNLLYLVVLTVLTHWLRLFVLLANLVAIAVGGAFNYLLHNAWTWRRGEPA